MKNLKLSFTIPGEREVVYAALTNPVIIEVWSGFDVRFEAKAGTEFSIWDGDIEGKNLEFIPGKLIKQQWYFEPQVEESIVTLTLSDKGKDTFIELLHTNIPDEAFEDMVEGWKKYYFGALKKYFM
ncbi:MAG: SRPBCC domain-containing protein [Bacteroidales bacterium]|nr:SRPBCC domain-containing protein [Bacteroidales bacterium]MBN2817385.1 SRPBCC domain-containing protein [Bacteroidales bacterium]